MQKVCNIVFSLFFFLIIVIGNASSQEIPDYTQGSLIVRIEQIKPTKIRGQAGAYQKYIQKRAKKLSKFYKIFGQKMESSILDPIFKEVSDTMSTKKLSAKDADKFLTSKLLAKSKSKNDLRKIKLTESLNDDEENYSHQYFQLNFSSDIDVDEVIGRINKNPNIKKINLKITEVNKNFFFQTTETVYMWGMVNIQINEAFKYTKGSKDVVIAVIDTGLDMQHSEFKNAVWINEDEIAFDGKDNDENGYVDDINGFNFLAKNGIIKAYSDHGTHVSGTIGARLNLDRVVGVCPECAIMPLPAGQQLFTLADIINALNYAANNGADVVNMSLGGPAYVQVFQNAINAAAKKGVIIVASAGNNGDTIRMYPAAYTNVISVAATTVTIFSNTTLSLASFSTRGSWVDIAAPGENILSTVVGGGTNLMSGTSMAAPHIAGAVGLILSLNKTNDSDLILKSFQDSGYPVSGSTLKSLNLSESIKYLLKNITPTPTPTKKITF